MKNTDKRKRELSRIDLTNENQVNRYIREAAVAKLLSNSTPISEMEKTLGVHRTTIYKDIENTTHGSYKYTGKACAGMSDEEFKSRLDEMLNQGSFRKTLRLIANDPQLMVDVAVERTSREKHDYDGFMPRAGQLISRLLDRAKLVGLGWGDEIRPYSISIPGFASRDGEDDSKEPIRFIPVCGISESLEDSLIRSSTVLAIRYDKLVNQGYEGMPNKPKLYNLNSLPISHSAFSQFGSKKSKEIFYAIRNYIEEAHPDYTDIFGSDDSRKKPLIERVDTILTSVGPSGKALLSHLKRWFPEKIIPLSGQGVPATIPISEICKKHAIGDIAGILLPKPGVEFEMNRRICNEVNSYLATLRPEHLKKCREKTIENHRKYQVRVKRKPDTKEAPPPAGVILIIDRKQNIDSFLSALSEGYASRVIMSLEVETEIKNRILKCGDKEPTLEMLCLE